MDSEIIELGSGVVELWELPATVAAAATAACNIIIRGNNCKSNGIHKVKAANGTQQPDKKETETKRLRLKLSATCCNVCA